MSEREPARPSAHAGGEADVRGATPADTPPADAAAGGPTGASSDGPNASLLALVDRLASTLSQSGLDELEVESGGTTIVLRSPAAIWRPGEAAGAVAEGAPAPSEPAGAARAVATAESVPETAASAIVAPLTGIWYTSPAPGSEPYVRVGGEVAVGQVVGLIEAMKLFNEIKSDTSGRVTRLLAESGTLVKARQPLIEVEPL